VENKLQPEIVMPAHQVFIQQTMALLGMLTKLVWHKTQETAMAVAVEAAGMVG
jgi:hypothetical protein